jgi:hypothetical protein
MLKIWVLMSFHKFRYILILTVIVLSLTFLYQEIVGDFSLDNITLAKSNRSSFLMTEEVQGILTQKFYYLGEGKQTYAFVSEDGSYVLKFFKKFNPSIFFQFYPQSYQEKLKRSQQKQLDWAFTGYALAFEADRENSALILVHFQPSEDLKTLVYDKLGRAYQASLNQTVFVLQKKGDKTKNILMNLFNHHEIEAAKAHIGALFDLYLSEYNKGLYDRDHNVMHNTGFIGDKPFRIDLGRLRKNEAMKSKDVFKKDLEKIAWKRIDPWMKKYYPQHRAVIKEYLEKKLKEIFA